MVKAPRMAKMAKARVHMIAIPVVVRSRLATGGQATFESTFETSNSDQL